MRLDLGLVPAVVISSRDAAGEAFTSHDRRLAARAVPDSKQALGFCDWSVIWLPCSDPLWKTLRGIVASHVFSPRSLAATRAVRERKVRDLVAFLRGRAGREVDVKEAVYGGVINLVSSSLFSVDVGAESAHGLQELVDSDGLGGVFRFSLGSSSKMGSREASLSWQACTMLIVGAS